MKLEPANIVCPKCGSPNYMRHLIGRGVGKLDMKCINCNSYFNFDELYNQKIAEVIKSKPQTNADRIRSMTDELMAEWFAAIEAKCYERCDYNCNKERFEKQWLDWLKQEVEE